MIEIRWSSQAGADLEDIERFIAKDSPVAAEALLRRIIDATANLAAAPQLGRMVPEAQDPRIRELLVGSYRVIYAIRDDAIEVISLRHGARQRRDERR